MNTLPPGIGAERGEQIATSIRRFRMIDRILPAVDVMQFSGKFTWIGVDGIRNKEEKRLAAKMAIEHRSALRRRKTERV